MWGGRQILAAVFLATTPSFASAACIAIETTAQLDNIRDNLTGDYCLANDLDMHGVKNFVPIGDQANPFAGTFNGGHHTISFLETHRATDIAGLFGTIQYGTVKNLRLAGVNIRPTKGSLVGGLAGLLSVGARISDVSVSGTVVCGNDCRAGGIAGQSFDRTVVTASSSSARVVSGNGGAAGGLIGQSGGELEDVYATGAVTCGNNCGAGGLSGYTFGSMRRVFATGRVKAKGFGAAGGLIGVNIADIVNAFATGPVSVDDQGASGLVGANSARLTNVYAAGRLSAECGCPKSGVVDLRLSGDPVTHAYWDTQTTTTSMSAEGSPRTTTALRAAKPSGFGPQWRITKGFSYPYLMSAKIDFKAPLSTLIRQNLIYTFLPIAQLERPEYLRKAPNAKHASLAAAYTMIARAIGVTRNDAALADVKIDKYFWNDATMTATWTGPVATRAKLGPLKTIGPATPLNGSNVVGALRTGHVVLLRATYLNAWTPEQHWMLATLFTSDANGSVTHVIALDPGTGRQIKIDPATKQVTSSNNDPFADFKFDAYRVVTLK